MTGGRWPALEELDKPGEHMWVMVGAIVIADPDRPTDRPPLGGDITGPGCFKCERVYSRRLARQRCKGSLS